MVRILGALVRVAGAESGCRRSRRLDCRVRARWSIVVVGNGFAIAKEEDWGLY